MAVHLDRCPEPPDDRRDDRPRPPRHRHDPDAVDRRGPAGQFRASWRPDGRGGDGLHALDAVPAARPDASGLARPRPVRAVGRARQHAPLLAPASHRLRRHARRSQVVPPVGQPHAGSPGVRPHAGRRGDDRPARAGHHERGRHGHRGAASGRRVQPGRPGDRRPPDLRDRIRRRPPGGHRLGGGQPGRSPAPGQAHRPVRRQPHPARRTHRDGLVRGRAGALRRLRLAHPARHRWQRRPSDRRGHRGRPGRRATEPDRRPDAHRVRQPEQAGHPEGARRTARPGRGPPRQGGLRLGSGRHVRRAARRRWPSSAPPCPRARRASPSGRNGSPASRTPIPSWPRSSDGASPGSLADGWDADLKTYDVGSEVATRNASQDAIQALAGRVPELFGGAADLSESNLTDVKGEPNFSADDPGRNLRFGVREHAMGGDRQRDRLSRRVHPVRRDLPDVQRLHARLRPVVRARRDPRHRRLDARLGGPRRGRTDPPACRALRGAARDPEPVVRATR